MEAFRTYYIYIPSIIVSLGLTLFILLNDHRNKQNVVFSLISLATSLWLLALLLSDSLPGTSSALLWSQVALIPPAFIPPLLFTFSLIFPRKVPINVQIVKFLVFLPALGITLLAFTDLNVSSVIRHSWGTEVISGPLYSLFLAYFLSLLVASLYNFWRTFREADNIHKSQIAYTVTGLVIGILATLATNVIMVILGNSSLAAIGTASVLFFTGFTIYAMVTKRLFDVRIVLTEIAVVLVLFGLLVQSIMPQQLWLRISNICILGIAAYGGYLIVGSVKNEIERRKEVQRLASQLEKANAQLKKMDELKDDFISMASHELNTPISAIKGYLSMILDEGIGGKIPDQVKGYLEKMSSCLALTRLLIFIAVNTMDRKKIEKNIKEEFITGVKTIFEDNLVFAFICGGFAKGYWDQNHDIDIFVCIKNAINKEKAMQYLNWYHGLHRQFGFPADNDYPGEIVEKKILIKTLNLLKNYNLHLKVTKIAIKESIIWADMIVGRKIGLTGNDLIFYQELRSKYDRQPDKWKKEVLAQISMPDREKWKNKSYLLIMEKFMLYPKKDVRCFHKKYGISDQDERLIFCNFN